MLHAGLDLSQESLEVRLVKLRVVSRVSLVCRTGEGRRAQPALPKETL